MFIDRIVTYCEDTIAVAQIFLRLRREELLIEEEIHVRNFNTISKSMGNTILKFLLKLTLH
jgi:hypothetical protein